MFPNKIKLIMIVGEEEHFAGISDIIAGRIRESEDDNNSACSDPNTSACQVWRQIAEYMKTAPTASRECAPGETNLEFPLHIVHAKTLEEIYECVALSPYTILAIDNGQHPAVIAENFRAITYAHFEENALKYRIMFNTVFEYTGGNRPYYKVNDLVNGLRLGLGMHLA